MTSEEAVRLTREHVESRFPLVCKNCGARYESLRSFLVGTRHLGLPLSGDAEVGDWEPARPIGTAAFVNCACGSTLTVDSSGMRLTTLFRLMAWARIEASRRGVSFSDVLGWVRSQIDQQVLAETQKGGPAQVGRAEP